MGKRLRRIFVSLLIVVLLAVELSPVLADEPTLGPPPLAQRVSASDWMGQIDDEAYLNSMNIPGTHDSGMYYCTDTTATYAITQYVDVAAQLERGARIFDIRLRYGGNNKAAICHGAGSFWRYDAQVPAKTKDGDDTPYTYDMVLTQIADFLNAHPTETVILTVQHESDADDEKEDFDANGNAQNTYSAVAKAEDDLARALNVADNPIIRYHKTNRFSVYTKMGEARGRVIIFDYDEVNGMGFGDLMPSTRNNYDVTFAEKWNVILPFFNSAGVQHIKEFQPQSKFRAAYTSSTGQYAYNEKGEKIRNNAGLPYTKYIVPTPKKEADGMTVQLMSYPFKKGAYYGWVSMDFITEDLARRIFETNIFKNESEGIVENPQTYISEIKGFVEDDYDDALENCLGAGYTVLVGKKQNGSQFRDVNPDGDHIVIGYKTTIYPERAIRDIVGSLDEDDCPRGYDIVEVIGSSYNHFTRGTGLFTSNTYMFYSKTVNKKPITELALREGANYDEGFEMVMRLNSTLAFNLQDSLDRFYSVSMKRDADASFLASMISAGDMFIAGGIIIFLAGAAALFIVLDNKYKKIYDNAKKE